MITEKETFKLKNKILAEIATMFEAHLKSGKIANPDDANEIVNFVNKEIDTAIHPRKFTRAVQRFCEKFPAFAMIEKKLQSMRLELIQQIGQECIENLMEDAPDQWEALSEELIQGTEDTLGSWLAKLPEANYTQFTVKVFHPQEA